jgi:hypothetical protein
MLRASIVSPGISVSVPASGGCPSGPLITFSEAWLVGAIVGSESSGERRHALIMATLTTPINALNRYGGES